MTAHSPVHAVQACLTAVFSCGLLLACSRELPLPPYEANPDPKDVWEVVVTLHDAPADMTVDAAYVLYQITDESCLPPINNYAGIRREPRRHHLNITLHRMNATTYTGTYFADGLLRKDYYGYGQCNWSVSFVGSSLTTESTRSFTYFTIAARPDKHTSTRYAEKAIRPFKKDGKVYPARDWSEQMYAELSDEEKDALFSFSLSIKKREDAE